MTHLLGSQLVPGTTLHDELATIGGREISGISEKWLERSAAETEQIEFERKLETPSVLDYI